MPLKMSKYLKFLNALDTGSNIEHQLYYIFKLRGFTDFAARSAGTAAGTPFHASKILAQEPEYKYKMKEDI